MAKTSKLMNAMLQLFCSQCGKVRWHNLALKKSAAGTDVWRCTGCRMERGK